MRTSTRPTQADAVQDVQTFLLCVPPIHILEIHQRTGNIFAKDNEAVSAKVLEQIEVAFAEDFAILEAQQHSLDTYAVTDDIELALDSAPTRHPCTMTISPAH